MIQAISLCFILLGVIGFVCGIEQEEKKKEIVREIEREENKYSVWVLKTGDIYTQKIQLAITKREADIWRSCGYELLEEDNE